MDRRRRASVKFEALRPTYPNMKNATHTNHPISLLVAFLLLPLACRAQSPAPHSFEPRSKILMMIALMTALFTASVAQAALYQWSIPQEPGRRAYLWIPEKCQRIRGLVVDMNNLTESAIIENAAVRGACAQERVGILWIAEGSWAVSPLANEWGDPAGLSKEQRKIYNDAMEIARKAGKEPTPEQAQAQATVKTMKRELVRQAEEELNNMLRGLAKESGYEEVERAPLLIIGHSMTGLITWAMPYWIPGAHVGRGANKNRRALCSLGETGREDDRRPRSLYEPDRARGAGRKERTTQLLLCPPPESRQSRGPSV